MAKKSFKGNPALQFISAPQPEETAVEPAPEPTPTQPEASPRTGYKPNPLYIEKKTRRMQLVLQPSLYDRVKRQAKAQGVSINEYVSQALDKAVREE